MEMDNDEPEESFQLEGVKIKMKDLGMIILFYFFFKDEDFVQVSMLVSLRKKHLPTFHPPTPFNSI